MEKMRLRRPAGLFATSFVCLCFTTLLGGCAVFRTSGAPDPKRMPDATQKLGVAGISIGLNLYGRPGIVGKKLAAMADDELSRTGVFAEVKPLEPMEISDVDFLVESRILITQDGNVPDNNVRAAFSRQSLGLVPFFGREHYTTEIILKDRSGKELFRTSHTDHVRMISWLPVFPAALIPSFWPGRVERAAFRKPFHRGLAELVQAVNALRAEGRLPAPAGNSAGRGSSAGRREFLGNGFRIARPDGQWFAAHTSSDDFNWGRNDGAYDTYAAYVGTNYLPDLRGEDEFRKFVWNKVIEGTDTSRFSLVSSTFGVSSACSGKCVVLDAVWKDAAPAVMFKKRPMNLRLKTYFRRHPDDDRFLVAASYSSRTIKPLAEDAFSKEADAFLSGLSFAAIAPAVKSKE